jgi:phosphatidylinositol-3-phosphatase
LPAPYINSIAGECGLATNYHNISHPSLPNYIAGTSGLPPVELSRLTSDCSPSRKCSTAAQSIFGQVPNWKAYEESMPKNCDRKNSGEYAVRHNPPPYYTQLSECEAKDVPYTSTLFNHYSLLGSAEQLLGVSLLEEAAGANSMLAAFNL